MQGLFFFFFFILHLQVVCSSFSSSPILCSPEQSVALLHFKNTFFLEKYASGLCEYFNQFSGYPKTKSWKEGSDCCLWDGVTCDRFTGHVIGLDLSSSWLRGSVHENSSLFLLHHLQKLNLACNDFLGSQISPKIGKFTKLTHLNLSYSNLSGLVPAKMFLLSDFISLDLSNDGLSVDQHGFNKLLQNLTELRYLRLDSVNMSTVSVGSLVNLSSSLISLDLYNTDMQGKFPNEIFLFPFLRRLGLSFNIGMTGNLPEFNKSSPLRVLDISFTSFSGKLPDTFGNLMHLNHLSLYDSNFHGSLTPSLGNLTEITILDLSGNDFTGQVPTSSSKLVQLTWLSLAYNNFTGKFPDVLGNLSKLEKIDLSFNNFNGQLPTSVFTLNGLVFLYFSDNQFQGQFPSQISGLSYLRGIFLSNNLLRGRVPAWLFNLPSLERLDLSKNTISGRISLLEFANRSSFFLLNLSHNLLTNFECIPSMAIAQLDLSSNLLRGQLVDLPTPAFFFSVSNNDLTGEIPPSFCNSSGYDSLDLSYNDLSGNIPQCLVNSSIQLGFLNLAMNNFRGSVGSLIFPNFCRVTGLMLNDNQLEGPLPSSLVNCQNLNILDVGNNRINDSFPNWLVSFQNLEVLVLRSNQFHGPIRNSSSRFFLNHLRVLDLSHNQFSGNLPTSFFNNFDDMMSEDMEVVNLHYMQSLSGSYYSIILCVKGVETKIEKILSIFTSIDLSNNLFEGEIPKMIAQLKSLRLLNLSHNSLTGEIPSSLKNLSQLEALDLSFNQLIGKIPMQLTSLTFLSVLNLSYNHLVGSIPQGNQFDTFQNDSYIGNLGLCGPPLSNKCDNDTSTPTTDEEESDVSSWFDWKIALMGYGSGFVIGISIAYIVFSTGKPQFVLSWIEREHPRNVRRLNRWRRERKN